jgi:hypothetical protein
LLLNLSLPRIDELMRSAVVEAVHAKAGDVLGVGAKLMDLRVDLSEAVFHDCPPVSHYLIAMRDEATLMRLDVAEGDELTIGASLALFATDPAEALDGPVEREARVSIIAILQLPKFWNAS